jgi:hypothetical protein
MGQGLAAEIRSTTLGRWLSHDAVGRLKQRSAIFSRDPNFAERPDPNPRSLQTHQGGPLLGADDSVILHRPKDEQASRPPETADAPAGPSANRALSRSTFVELLGLLSGLGCPSRPSLRSLPVQSGMARYRLARQVMSQMSFGS